jgi:hypothetical protein
VEPGGADVQIAIDAQGIGGFYPDTANTPAGMYFMSGGANIKHAVWPVDTIATGNFSTMHLLLLKDTYVPNTAHSTLADVSAHLVTKNFTMSATAESGPAQGSSSLISDYAYSAFQHGTYTGNSIFPDVKEAFRYVALYDTQSQELVAMYDLGSSKTHRISQWHLPLETPLRLDNLVGYAS